MKAAPALILALLLGGPALADDGGREAEAFLRDYTRVWATKDPAALSARFYRFDNPATPMATQAGVAAEFARLAEAGYDRSAIAGVEGCQLSPQSALGVIRFTRLLRDGRPMPPKDRATLYVLRRFPDGWRITAMVPMSASAHIACRSAALPAGGPRD
jgi:hypothetical protein